MTQTDPVYRTILLFDIERFGRRDNVEQAYLRRMLYDVVDATLLAAGVDETSRLRADRGDSVMELIDTRISVPALTKTLLSETPALLHGKNRLIAESTRMRLRMVLSAGYVAVDELGGWVGRDLNHAVRLLDSDPLKDALKARGDDCVLCASDAIYQGVVSDGPLGVRPEDFHRITLDTKEGPTVAWLHGSPASGTTDSAAATGTGSPAQGAASSQHNETHVGGDHYGPSGGTSRDLNYDFGSARRGEGR
ncbi:MULTISPECIES: hypothetical protein [Streptomyces]|uniref:Aromatic ring-opening dioxygenase LigA n=1 Tax=Streptomyces sviceus (strain ATCC 29083 / DSM 924 / JCM 4929 / NBRC 13980 / NCIMB 11184 / NRRL 5439 / UC 5370) TaxID=463191 RepID=B5HQ38_STRX2|nr:MULTISPECIES: hypothetical protein [Streptomyces]EDY54943.1 conserved hypothetical protein [Streptomyces sviceus ATCC 29083]